MVFNAQAAIPRRYRCIGSNGLTSTDVRCHICSAAIKVTALLTLPAAWTGCSQLLAASVLCRAARRPGIAKSRADSTRYSERDVAVLCHLARSFLKMSKHPTLDHSTPKNILPKWVTASHLGIQVILQK